MTVKEVLEADWTVEEIKITVREASTTKFIIEYHIGENLNPYECKHNKYIKETKAGALYTDRGRKHLYIEQNIQYKHLPKKPQGKEACVGVITNNIPKELLELEIEYMCPYGGGKASEMHGYEFNCYVPAWFGIPGEDGDGE